MSRAIALAFAPFSAFAVLGATAEVELAVALSEAPDAPFFIEQPLNAGSHARNVSHGGVFDSETGSVKWGPLTGATDLVVRFDLIGDSAGLPPAELVSANESQALEATLAESAETSYSEWLLEAYPPATTPVSARDLHYDGDGDGLPNFAEYHLALNPYSPNPLGDFGSFHFDADGATVFQVDQRAGDASFHVLIEQVDLQGEGQANKVQGMALTNGDELVGREFSLGDLPSFFRLVYQPFPPAVE